MRVNDLDRAKEIWRQSPRLVGVHYQTYLLGQLATAVGWLVDDSDQIQHCGQAVAAASYAVLALRAHEYFRQRDAWESQAGPGLPPQRRSGGVTGPRSRWQAVFEMQYIAAFEIRGTGSF